MNDGSMRVLWVSLGLFGMAAAFGAGVMVGRLTASTTPPVAVDEALSAPPPLDQAVVPAPPADAAALAEQAVAPSAAGPCLAQAARSVPVRAFGAQGRVLASATGPTCDGATVRIAIEPGGGAKPYVFAAPARDLGYQAAAAPGSAQQAEVEGFLLRLLPDRPRSTADLPAWDGALGAPAGGALTTALTGEEWERFRAARAPLLCHPTSAFEEACVAVDPADGQAKVVGAQPRG